MNKEDILNYVKGYYTKTRQTKNGLFIYSGINKHIYTYISNEDIGKNYKKEDIDYLKEGLDIYKNEVEYWKGV